MPEERGEHDDRRRADEDAVWAQLVAAFKEEPASRERTWPAAEELDDDGGDGRAAGQAGQAGRRRYTWSPAREPDDTGGKGGKAGEDSGTGEDSGGEGKGGAAARDRGKSGQGGGPGTEPGSDSASDSGSDSDSDKGRRDTGNGIRTVHGVVMMTDAFGDPPQPGPRDYSLADDDEDEGHFVPPPPPPLPQVDPVTKIAWIAVLGGPLLLFAMVLFQQPVSWWMIVLGVGGFLGGFATLVARMPDDEDDEDPTGGAVV